MQKQWGLHGAGTAQPQLSSQGIGQLGAAPALAQGCAGVRPGCHPEGWTQLEAGTPAGLVSLGSGWAQMGLLGHRRVGRAVHFLLQSKSRAAMLPLQRVSAGFEENTNGEEQCVGKCPEGKAGQESP